MNTETHSGVCKGIFLGKRFEPRSVILFRLEREESFTSESTSDISKLEGRHVEDGVKVGNLIMSITLLGLLRPEPKYGMRHAVLSASNVRHATRGDDGKGEEIGVEKLEFKNDSIVREDVESLGLVVLYEADVETCVFREQVEEFLNETDSCEASIMAPDLPEIRFEFLGC